MYLYCSQQAQSSCRVQDKYCWCCTKAGTHYHSIHTAGQKRFCVCCLVSWCQSRSCNTPYIWYPIWELIHVASLNMSWDINISLHPIDSFWVSGIIYDDRMRESALALWCKPVLCSTMLFKQNLYICICISYTAPCVVHALCMVDLVPLQCALKSAVFLATGLLPNPVTQLLQAQWQFLPVTPKILTQFIWPTWHPSWAKFVYTSQGSKWSFLGSGQPDHQFWRSGGLASILVVQWSFSPILTKLHSTVYIITSWRKGRN